ncbi:CHASE2 domain-containing protein [Pseudomonas schmalbachii]|uniref:CHASE2 domain-containing protein n=1 Tax=Pseudomonas schmalbachii TaxID=2816993 RepID=A0ABS3TQ02_9PSED|nr:CHASE2 domain-containing protein [Pseudomonas schmalbachii]MBO3275741.1 CHASE2 domain-containing protein [Pseudomonas schmalbachii]
MAEAPRSFQDWLDWGANLLARFGHEMLGSLHHLPAALVVASLVTIGHHKFHLLDAVDTYAFLGIGNLTAFLTTECNSRDAKKDKRCRPPQITVAGIDQLTYEKHYRERSPLDRCQLRHDLRAFYESPRPPRMMVIDLDLSPTPTEASYGNVPMQDKNDCDEQLYKLITDNQLSTRTVLMEPFALTDPNVGRDARRNAWAWRQRMQERANVVFADGRLPVSYGVVTKAPCVPHGLAVAAMRDISVITSGRCMEKPDGMFLIAPRHYLSSLHTVNVGDIRLLSERFKLTDGDKITIRHLAYETKVVFFGGTYGLDDVFLTPIGHLYGVEVHAAAFMSLLEPASDFSHLLAFLLEVAIGLLFGVVISWCWGKYYHLRFSNQERYRLSAPWVVLGLGFALCVLLVVVTMFSYLQLRDHNLWLSPIPIALGMLIESFFTGAVHGAVKEGLRERWDLAEKLEQAFDAGPKQFHAALQQARQDAHDDHPVPVRKPIHIDPLRPFREDWVAASLKLAGRLLFLTLVATALGITLSHVS